MVANIVFSRKGMSGEQLKRRDGLYQLSQERHHHFDSG